METKRFIFDLDGTLLTADFDRERRYFDRIYGAEAPLITFQMGRFLDEYEKTYPFYTEAELSSFLSEKSGLNVTEEVINGWIDIMAYVEDTKEEGIVELLDYLKNEGHSLAVLTNWFSKTQIPRLERSGLLPFFDNIYTGEQVLKPHKESYQTAMGDYSKEDCIMIGDNLEKDYIGPRACSIEAILYDKNNTHWKKLTKVKKMNEIIDRYKER